MDEVEDAPTRFIWYVRTRKSIAYIHYNVVTTNVHRLEIQATSSFIPETLELGVEGLLSGDFFPVHSQVANGIYYAHQVRSRGLEFGGGSGSVLLGG